MLPCYTIRQRVWVSGYGAASASRAIIESVRSQTLESQKSRAGDRAQAASGTRPRQLDLELRDRGCTVFVSRAFDIARSPPPLPLPPPPAAHRWRITQEPRSQRGPQGQDKHKARDGGNGRGAPFRSSNKQHPEHDGHHAADIQASKQSKLSLLADIQTRSRCVGPFSFRFCARLGFGRLT